MTPAALSALAKGDIKNAIVASTPGGIEAQEKEGQIEQSFADTLPIKGTHDQKEVFEAMGFVFGTPTDDIFVNVTFPPGWRKVPTQHSMWTDVVDEKNRTRAAIFYKAAFYDRSAHIRLTTRFGYSSYSDVTPERYATVVTDGEKTIHTIAERGCREYELGSLHQDQAMAWLNENYPEWKNPLAYWDDSSSDSSSAA